MIFCQKIIGLIFEGAYTRDFLVFEKDQQTNFAPSPKGLKQGATTTQGRARVAI